MGKYKPFLPKVDKPFIGKPPKGTHRKKKWIGKIIDFIQVPDNGVWGKYYKTIELIEMKDGGKKDGERYVRFGYYKFRQGAYRIAGQTTFMAPPKLTWSLIQKAKRKGIFK
jgi:hypothetical protein